MTPPRVAQSGSYLVPLTAFSHSLIGTFFLAAPYFSTGSFNTD